MTAYAWLVGAVGMFLIALAPGLVLDDDPFVGVAFGIMWGALALSGWLEWALEGRLLGAGVEDVSWKATDGLVPQRPGARRLALPAAFVVALSTLAGAAWGPGGDLRDAAVVELIAIVAVVQVGRAQRRHRAAASGAA
jgi:hypothetical protein